MQSDAWHYVCRESGRRAGPHGVGAACPEVGELTLFSHSGVQLHLSMALPAQAPLPVPNGAALPDFPRCPFPLC